MLRFDDEERPLDAASPTVADPALPERHPGEPDEAGRRFLRQVSAITGALWLWMLAYLLRAYWLPPLLAALRDVQLLAALALAALAWLGWRLLPLLYKANGRDRWRHDRW